jgi:VanZ family protein
MGKKTKKYIWYHLPWQLLMITIFFLSSIPGNDLPDLGFRSADKVVHLLIFGTLAILIFRSFRNSGMAFLRANAAFFAITTTLLYGALDEFHQIFVPGRTASVWDWAADLTGALLLVLLYKILIQRQAVVSENRET